MRPIQKRPIFCKIKASGNPLISRGIESPRSGAKKSRGWAEAYIWYAAQLILQIDTETCLPLAGCEKSPFLGGH